MTYGLNAASMAGYYGRLLKGNPLETRLDARARANQDRRDETQARRVDCTFKRALVAGMRHGCGCWRQ